MVVGQKVALGRANAGKTVTFEVTDTDLTAHIDAGPHTLRRTNDQPSPRRLGISSPPRCTSRFRVQIPKHASLRSLQCDLPDMILMSARPA